MDVEISTSSPEAVDPAVVAHALQSAGFFVLSVTVNEGERKWTETADFKVGDWALHKSNQLDSRQVVAVGEVDGEPVIDLQIGAVRTGPVPAANYWKVGD